MREANKPTTLFMGSKEPLLFLFVCACGQLPDSHSLFAVDSPRGMLLAAALSFLLASLARSPLFLCDYLICLGSLIV